MARFASVCRRMWAQIVERRNTVQALRAENATLIQRAWRSNWRRRQLRCAATAIRWHAAAVTVQRYSRGWLYRRDWDAKLLRLLRRLCRRLTREVSGLRLALRRGEAVAAEQSIMEDKLMRRTLVRWHIGRRFRKWATYAAREANLRVVQRRIAGRFANHVVAAAYARWVEMVEELAAERAALADDEREQAAQEALQQMRTAQAKLADAEQRQAEAEHRTAEANNPQMTKGYDKTKEHSYISYLGQGREHVDHRHQRARLHPRWNLHLESNHNNYIIYLIRNWQCNRAHKPCGKDNTGCRKVLSSQPVLAAHPSPVPFLP